METILYIIIAYVNLVILYQTARAIKGYLKKQIDRREAEGTNNYTCQEIIIYGLLLLFSLCTLGAGAMIWFAASATDSKELK